MQYSDHVLNYLTAPDLTSLTDCGAVEVPALLNYDATLRIQQAVGSVKYENDNAVILIMTFVRRLKTAISEYNHGRQFLQKYVEALPGSHLLEAHQKALTHFENSILQLHVAVVSLAELGGGTDELGSREAQLYVKGDKSDYDRLRQLNNRIKHFEEDIRDAVKRNARVPIAPVWLTNHGFKCAMAALLFSEVETMFGSLANDAKDLSNP